MRAWKQAGFNRIANRPLPSHLQCFSSGRPACRSCQRARHLACTRRGHRQGRIIDSFPASPDEPSKQIQQTSGSSIESYTVFTGEVVIVSTLSSEVGGDEGMIAIAEAARDAALPLKRPGILFVSLPVCGMVRAKVWGNAVLCEQREVRIRSISSKQEKHR